MLENLRAIAGKDGKKDLVLLLGYIPLQIILSAILTVFLLYHYGYAPTISISNLQMTVTNLMQERITVISLFLASAITFVYILFSYKQLFLAALEEMKHHLKKNITIILLCYFILYIGIMLFSILTRIGVSTTQVELTDLIQGGTIGEQLMLCAATILFVPVVEEMICRKIIMGFSQNFPELKWILYIISSFLFGFFHYSIGTSIYTIIPYVFMGFVLGGSYLKTKNILVPISIHILNNLISTVAIFIFAMI